MADHSPIPKLTVTAQFTFQHVVLRTTYRQCVCGSRHKGVDLFEFWTAPARCAGRPTTATQMIPIYRDRIPDDVDVMETVVNYPLAICPDCIGRRPSLTPRPAPISEDAWARTLRKKAAESAVVVDKPSKTPIAVEDLDRELGL